MVLWPGVRELPVAAAIPWTCISARTAALWLSERLINDPMAPWSRSGARLALRWAGAGPVFPMCDDQEDSRARACPGYAPGRAGQGLSQ